MYKEVDSDWISGTDYVSDGPGTGTGTLVIYLKAGGAMVYRGIQSWVRGLLHSAQVKAKSGKLSVGAAYNRFIKNKGYNYARVYNPPVRYAHA